MARVATDFSRRGLCGFPFAGSAFARRDWKPSFLGGFKVWLDASQLSASNGDAIQTFTDLMGNFSPTQATSSKRPTFVADGINGRPAVRFDGVDDGLQVGPVVLLAGKEGGEIFYVGQNTGDPVFSSAAFFSVTVLINANGNLRLGLLQRNSLGYDVVSGRRLNTDSAQSVAVNPGYRTTPMIHCASADWANARLEKYENGALYGYLEPFQTSGVSGVQSTYLTIGGQTPATTFPALDVAEVLVFERRLTSTERTQVHLYLSRKYNIALAT